MTTAVNHQPNGPVYRVFAELERKAALGIGPKLNEAARMLQQVVIYVSGYISEQRARHMAVFLDGAVEGIKEVISRADSSGTGALESALGTLGIRLCRLADELSSDETASEVYVSGLRTLGLAVGMPAYRSLAAQKPPTQIQAPDSLSMVESGVEAILHGSGHKFYRENKHLLV